MVDTVDASQWAVMESWKQDVDVKIGEFVASSKVQAATIEDLCSMFASYMGTSKQREEGSPSIGQSALENRQSGDLPKADAIGIMPKPKNKVRALEGTVAFSAKTKKNVGVGVVKKRDARFLVKSRDIMLCESDSELTPLILVSPTVAPIVSDAEVPTLILSKADADIARDLLPKDPKPQFAVLCWTEVSRESNPCGAKESVPVVPKESTVEVAMNKAAPTVGGIEAATEETKTPKTPKQLSIEERTTTGEEDVVFLHEDARDEDGVDSDDGHFTPSSGGPPAGNSDAEGSLEELEEGQAVRLPEPTLEESAPDLAEVPEACKSKETTAVALEPSPKKTKKPPKSPQKVLSLHGVCQQMSSEVRPSGVPDHLIGLREWGPTKLVIFNVHGTLLDCSMLCEGNPNPRIRSSTGTASRRVVFRPWLKSFLTRCFQSFIVAFWGSGSREHMDDVLPTMLRGVKGVIAAPLFLWSGEHGESSHAEKGTSSEWGKQLEAVYATWPNFNAANTIIVDSKASRVECNPDANVIISTPFYVKWMCNLADDKEYLKRYLWPLLEAFDQCGDVAAF